QKSRAQLKEITRPAKTGDAVEIDFETKFNGIPVEHGSAKNYLFILGEGKFLPGFEEQIINETADAVKEFTLTAPENWPYENMRGQTLNFKITINKIQERILPEINDQFAKSLGNFENLEKLKNSIETGVLQEKEEKTKSENRMNIIEALLKQTKIEIPDSLIVHETDKMIDELKMTSEEAGLSFEDYLLQIKKTEAEIRIGFKEQAEKRIKSALMLKQIGISQEIPVSDEEIQEETKKIVEKARQEGHKGEFDSENLKEYIKGALRNEKVFAFLENKEK
ncbi:MAG: trigger factor, partial [Candidatus Parcubacteria bacterium]|nr:trigger factor [Candidatus Parcubacteria bacterium]